MQGWDQGINQEQQTRGASRRAKALVNSYFATSWSASTKAKTGIAVEKDRCNRTSYAEKPNMIGPISDLVGAIAYFLLSMFEVFLELCTTRGQANANPL
jgi:hypothetical protein